MKLSNYTSLDIISVYYMKEYNFSIYILFLLFFIRLNEKVEYPNVTYILQWSCSININIQNVHSNLKTEHYEYTYKSKYYK